MAYLYEDLTYKLRGLFFDVYNEIGPGFSENIYKRALIKALKSLNLPFETEKVININYKGESVGKHKLDLVVDNKVIIEIKATDKMHSVFETQTLRYLKSSKLKLAFLVNFGANTLKIKRYINQ